MIFCKIWILIKIFFTRLWRLCFIKYINYDLEIRKIQDQFEDLKSIKKIQLKSDRNIGTLFRKVKKHQF